MLRTLQRFAEHPCSVKQYTNVSVAVLQKSTRKAMSEKRTALMEWPLLGLDTCYLVSFLHTQLNPPGGFFAWWKVIKKLLDCKLCLRFKACRLLDILKLRAQRGKIFLSSGAILKLLIRDEPWSKNHFIGMKVKKRLPDRKKGLHSTVLQTR